MDHIMVQLRYLLPETRNEGMRMQKEEWNGIPEQFRFKGRLTKVERNTIGHINDTFILFYAQSDGTTLRYVLQRINQHVFHNPQQVMENIQAVTQHLRQKIVRAGGNPERETITLIPTIDGTMWHVSAAGDYWRACPFIEGTRTYEAAEQPDHFYNAGKAFGNFQNLLRDFPAETLHETIPQFHDTKKRFNDLMEAIDKDVANRAADVKEQIEFAQGRAEDASVVVDLLARGQIPLRVIHNDTKLNNVLICDVTGEGVCVLDLDTVMPGSALYDFGDAIRFGASTGAEDEQDLSKVGLDLDLFQQFAQGYVSSAGEFLTATEFDYLAFSAKLITYELGMRFLTDHLNGDVYFRIHRPGHNLDRARTQFKLVADMEAKMDEMQSIIEAEKGMSGEAFVG